MFNITQEKISDGCPPSIYQKGLSFFRDGRVKRLLFVQKEDKYIGTVLDTINYTVEIWTDKQGDMINYACSCPAFNQYYGYCKHLVATLLALDNNDKLREERETARSRKMLREILDSFNLEEPTPSREVVLKPTLIFQSGRDYLNENEASITLSIGENRLYVVKNMKSFLEQMQSEENIEFGKKFTYDSRNHFFSQEDREMLSLFSEVLQVSNTTHYASNHYSYSRWGDGPFSGKTIQLPEILLKKWLGIMKNRTFSAIINDLSYDPIAILEKDLLLDFFLEEKNNRLYLHGKSLKTMIPLTKDGEYFLFQDYIYHISLKQRQNLMPFYRGLITSPENALMILPEHKERLISELLPRIKKAGVLTIHDQLAQKIKEHPLKTEIYLDTEEGRIIAEIKFIYGDRVINPFASVSSGSGVSGVSGISSVSGISGVSSFSGISSVSGSDTPLNESPSIIIRDGEQEKRVMRFFENSGFHIMGTQVYLEDEHDIFQFVETTLPALQKEGEVFFSEIFRLVSKRPSPTFKGRVSINGESDLLELDFELEGINREELFDLFSALKEKKKYYRLKDGAFLPLASEELESMADFLDGLDLKKEDFARGRLELPKFRSMYLDSFMHRDRSGRFKRDKAFKELVQNVREPEDTDYTLPPHLEPVLRDYQKTGFKWLKTLASYGFGGILADDMGLGKTLETISFIESEKEIDPRPALVIAPTSVIFNWQAEIEKFAPKLTTLVVSGTKGERAALIERLETKKEMKKAEVKMEEATTEQVDVIITSYPLIRNDISLYQGKTFSSCILDEAQYIKNAGSLTAKSVKLISAQKYFALTGTPIENSLSELWSIFDFLMPGYLPSYKKFAQKYITPLKKEESNNVLGELAKKVSPFVLRRMKKDVVRELPDKIELKMVSELTREQKKIYLAYLEQIKQDIAGEIQKNGFEKSRIKILAGLTRLRQICCHPSLFLENFKGESGKLTQLEEVLADLKAGGHRCLLFSQFTSMLSIIRRVLDRENYRYFYLDGSVDSRDRLVMADAFNRGEEDLFLISLKAGGTGLNLTGADTVIHFDPWWNPAVEDQATDRAHRIGQDKVVNVLKFISLGTIEEKIFELQQKKKNLINEVIKPGETFLSHLNEKEIKEILEMA